MAVRRVLIRLAVRRFFCGNPGCPAVTFAELPAGTAYPEGKQGANIVDLKIGRRTPDELMVLLAGRTVGEVRALAEHVLQWARDAGYRSMQFNAVVSTNTVALRLWRSLGCCCSTTWAASPVRPGPPR